MPWVELLPMISIFYILSHSHYWQLLLLAAEAKTLEQPQILLFFLCLMFKSCILQISYKCPPLTTLSTTSLNQDFNFASLSCCLQTGYFPLCSNVALLKYKRYYLVFHSQSVLHLYLLYHDLQGPKWYHSPLSVDSQRLLFLVTLTPLLFHKQQVYSHLVSFVFIVPLLGMLFPNLP
jgi:hypothetical protein